MRIISFILLFVVFAIGLTFAILNADSVTFNYYIGSSHLPLSLLLVFALGLGIILGVFAMIPFMIRLKHANYQLKGRVKDNEKKVSNLRTIPIEEH